jgi:TfoX/Sxy family transcriptional regulator of competence genes
VPLPMSTQVSPRRTSAAASAHARNRSIDGAASWASSTLTMACTASASTVPGRKAVPSVNDVPLTSLMLMLQIGTIRAMAYDEMLAGQLREIAAGVPGVSERKMFGGLAFLVNGNMAVSASSQGGLLLRVDPNDTGTLVAEPHVERFVMRGREMDGWLHVEPAAVESDDALRSWVARGAAYAGSLPAK